MKTPLPGLRRLLIRAWLDHLLHRSLQWFGLAILILSFGTGISLILSLPLRIYTGLFLALASTFPIALLWPSHPALLGQALRSRDPDSAIEAWLESGEGPARELLSRRATARLEELTLGPPPPRHAFRGLARLYAAVALALLLLQVGSLLWLGRPILLYSGPPVRAGSGQRLDEQSFDSRFDEDPAARLATREGIESEEAAGRDEESSKSGDRTETTGRPGLENFGLPNRGSSDEGGTQASGDLAQPDRQAEGQSRELEAGNGQEEDSLAAEGEAGPNGGSRRVERRDGAATGFEDGGASGLPSPLLDYRSKFFKILAERTKKETQASGELSLGELKDYERRYFASFGLSAGLGPVEEAYAALLKRRWRELREKKK